MSGFIKIGRGNNEMFINKNDIVSIEKESRGFVSICYKTADETGKNPYYIEKTSFGLSSSEYAMLIEELNKD